MEHDKNINKKMDKLNSVHGVSKQHDPQPIYMVGNFQLPAHILSALGNERVKKLFEEGTIQAKLDISAPGDKLEKQADTLAEKMVQNKPDTNAVNNAMTPFYTGVGIQSSGNIFNDSENGNTSYSTIIKRLSKPLRDYFEPMIGKELKDIEIHTDSKANEMAEAINARAFTHKNHIVFNKGEYQPGTTEGKKLIAHELVHTVQQSGGIMRKEKDGSQPAVNNGWFVTHENGKLFIEFKPPVTDEAIDIRKLANKLVEGVADGGQLIQIFVKLKTMGMVKGTMAPGSTYTFKDTPIMKGLSPKGKVDVSFLYNLGFVKKPANAVVEALKPEEKGFDLGKAFGDVFGAIGGFFKGLGKAYLASLQMEGERAAVLLGRSSTKESEKKIDKGLDQRILAAIENHMPEDYIPNPNQKADKDHPVNNCDIWLETILMEANVVLPKNWKPAITTNVDTHIKNLSKELLKVPAIGWNIVLMQDSEGSLSYANAKTQGKHNDDKVVKADSHAALIRKNDNGTIEMFQMGGNIYKTNKNKYDNYKVYENSFHYQDTFFYLPL
ncbi:MAG: DUF4157 domain-containing protein [Spirochaetales bacterium]|nr:DUF4157 domain-containing protein [Spirochaetales bacterium]